MNCAGSMSTSVWRHRNKADRDPVGEVDDRLQRQPQLVVRDRSPQVGLQLQARHHCLAHALLEHLDATATALLGPMQRQPRVAQQRVGRRRGV
jgi:hypothetical protein